jgi:hypothetical protein
MAANEVNGAAAEGAVNADIIIVRVTTKSGATN